jgi:hypothetical protein
MILERVASIYRGVGWLSGRGNRRRVHRTPQRAGPSQPWHLYRFTFCTVIGLSTAEPNGATCRQFGQ